FIHPDGSVGGEYASRNTMFYYPAAYEMLYEYCEFAKIIASHQREFISKDNGVGLRQMDSYNLYPVLNNYIFANTAFGQNKSKRKNEIVSKIPYGKNFIKNFDEAGIFIISKGNYYVIISAKKGGVIKIFDKKNKQIHYQTAGYLIKLKKNWISSQSLDKAMYNFKKYNNGSTMLEINTKFYQINQKTLNPVLFLFFRLYSIIFARFSALSYLIKKVLVKVLISKKKEYPIELNRKILIANNRITIDDFIKSGIKCNAFLVDKFTTYHMGSSKYTDLNEEEWRASIYEQDKTKVLNIISTNSKNFIEVLLNED
ncbi:MAG: hypothetical protein ACFFDN_44055, partial [Candidatus Hodarchaeota archaeon]